MPYYPSPYYDLAAFAWSAVPHLAVLLSVALISVLSFGAGFALARRVRNRAAVRLGVFITVGALGVMLVFTVLAGALHREDNRPYPMHGISVPHGPDRGPAPEFLPGTAPDLDPYYRAPELFDR